MPNSFGLYYKFHLLCRPVSSSFVRMISNLRLNSVHRRLFSKLMENCKAQKMSARCLASETADSASPPSPKPTAQRKCCHHGGGHHNNHRNNSGTGASKANFFVNSRIFEYNAVNLYSVSSTPCILMD